MQLARAGEATRLTPRQFAERVAEAGIRPPSPRSAYQLLEDMQMLQRQFRDVPPPLPGALDIPRREQRT